MTLSNILITGSTGGLGSNLAYYYANKGHELILHGRDEKKLKEIAGKINKNRKCASFFLADLNSETDINSLCEYAKKKNVKYLINNAGITCPNLPLCDMDFKIIDSMIYVNLIAPIKITKNLINILDQVININSMVGLEAKKHRTLYAASKWGLKGFSDSLKLESNECKILDVYPTNIKTWPERENAMDIEFVLDKINNAVKNGVSELIIDGRKKNE